MARLDFYINRAGSNLSGDDKARLESAKEQLEGMFDSALDSVKTESAIVTEESNRRSPKNVRRRD